MTDDDDFAKQGRALARRLRRSDEKRAEREARMMERFGTTWVSFPPGSPEAEQFRIPTDPAEDDTGDGKE